VKQNHHNTLLLHITTMADKLLKKEIEKWVDDPPEESAEAMLELQDINVKDRIVKFTIGEDEHAFTLSYSDKYPTASDVSIVWHCSKENSKKKKARHLIFFLKQTSKSTTCVFLHHMSICKYYR
jgi:hypothetical protein